MYIYTVNRADKIEKVVSLLSPEEVADKGLPSQAILGSLKDSLSSSDVINSDNFVPNQKFVEFLHNIIAKYAPQLPKLCLEAQQQKQGWVYIIDGRCSNPRGRVLPEDIIGGFEVKEGQINSESYQRNRDHLIFSRKGLFKLEPKLQEYLIEEFRNLSVTT